MKNVLYLEKRGCNFWDNDEIKNVSDVGNYRVFVEFVDKDGVSVCGDFGRRDVFDFYFKNGKKRAKPKLIDRFGLHADLQYDSPEGAFTYKLHKCAELCESKRYTLEDILWFVNQLVKEPYTEIRFK